MQDREHFSPRLSLRAWFAPDFELAVQCVAEEETGEAQSPQMEGDEGKSDRQ